MQNIEMNDEERDELEKTYNLPIELLPIKSGNIQAMGYSKEHQLLRVLFKSGTLYQYRNVPSDVYEQVVKSNSIGSSFSRIKNFYPYTRM
jgi:hypothetical protein